MKPIENSSVLGLLRRRRWILLAAVVVSAGTALPFTLSAPPEYVSHAQVLIPASDPVTTKTTQVSAITIQLQAFAQSGLGDQVRSALGSRASSLHSITAVQQRSEDVYVITADAAIPSIAEGGVAQAAMVLIRRSNELALQQVERLKDRVDSSARALTQELAALGEQRRDLAKKVRRSRNTRAHLPAAPSIKEQAKIQALSKRLQRLREEKLRTNSHIDIVTSERDGLQALVEEATDQYLKRQAASTLISPPSAPDTTVRTRIISTVGLALLVGLVVSFLTILGIERWSQRRRRRAGIESSRLLGEQLELSLDGSDKRTVRAR